MLTTPGKIVVITFLCVTALGAVLMAIPAPHWVTVTGYVSVVLGCSVLTVMGIMTTAVAKGWIKQ